MYFCQRLRSRSAQRRRSPRLRSRASISSSKPSRHKGAPAALNAAKTTIIKGEAKHWEPGQSYSPTGEARFIGDSTYTQTVDNANRMSRTDWDRDMKYVAVERLKYSDITAPTFGVSIDDKGVQQPMSGIRLAAALRERERASPRLLVRALDDPQSITAMPDQKLGERTLPAVSIKGTSGTFIVLFDRATKLPAAVRTRDADNVYGDSDYDMILSDWKPVGATKRAHTLSFQLGGREVQRLTLKDVTTDAPIPANTFAVNDDDQGQGEAGRQRRALSMGAAKVVPGALPRQRQDLFSGERRLQARRIGPERAARGRGRRQ